MTVVEAHAGELLLAGDTVESCDGYVASGGGTGLANAVALGSPEGATVTGE